MPSAKANKETEKQPIAGANETKQLDALETEKVATLTKATKSQEDSQSFAKDLGAELSAAERKLNAEGAAIQTFHTTTSVRLTQYITGAKDRVTGTVNSALDSMRLLFWVVAGLFLVSGGLAADIIATYWPTYLIGFVPVWVAIGVATLWGLSSNRNSLDAEPKSLNSDVNKWNTWILGEVSKYPTPQNDFSLVEKSKQLLTSAVDEVVSTTIEFTDLGDKVIAHKEKALRRDQFVDRFIYSLSRYGFDSSRKDFQLFFKAKAWLVENEQWLGNLAKAGSEKFPDTHEILFELMYREVWNKDDLMPTWLLVRDSLVVRDQFTKLLIRQKLVSGIGSTEKWIKPLGELLGTIEIFSLEETKKMIDQFVNNVASFKNECITILDSYGLGVVIDKDKLLDYVPTTSNTEEWRKAVVTSFASQVFGKGNEDESNVIESNVIGRLILFEGLGDNHRVEVWTAIRNSAARESLLSSMGQLLVKQRIPKLLDDFSNQVFVEHIMLVLESSTDDFLVREIQARVKTMELEILQVKRGITKTAERYRFGLSEFDFVTDYIPTSTVDIEGQLLNELAGKAGIPLELSKLFYFNTVGSDKGEDVFRKMEEKDLIEINDFLVKKNLLPDLPFNAHVPALLKTQLVFDRATLRDIYDKYEKLTAKLDTFVPFLIKHDMQAVSTPPSFKEVLKKCPPTRETDFLTAFLTLTRGLVNRSADGSILTDVQLDELNRAACLLSLKLDNDPASAVLAAKVAFDPLGARVLYRYSKLISAAVSKQDEPQLKKALLEAIPEIVGDPSFDFFKGQLQQGILVVSASSLLSERLDELKTIASTSVKLGLENKVLQNYVDSTKEFLSAQVDMAVITEFLTTEVLSAYLLTIPPKTALINWLHAHEQDLFNAAEVLSNSEKDERYKTLRQFDEGSGRSTRIGLVPFGMRFEEFTKMFETLFEKAREISGTQEKLPFYITRIFASEDAMKEIMPTGLDRSPLEVVKELVQNKVQGADSISLLALLEPISGNRLAYKTVLTRLLDTHGNNIYTLTKDLIGDVLQANPALATRFSDGTLDTELRARYAAPSTSELCKIVDGQVKASDESTALSTLTERLTTILPELQDVAESEQKIVMGAVFRRLRVAGTVLNL